MVSTSGGSDSNPNRKPGAKEPKRKRNLDDWLLLSNRHANSSASALNPTNRRTVSEGRKSRRVCIDLTLDDSDDEANYSGSILAEPKGDPPASLLSVLRDNTIPGRKMKRLAPLRLTTPEMVSKHTPLTMHLSILPLELSCRLYHAMMKASEDWSRNKWWLADRMVESPHTTSFYARRGNDADYDWSEAAQYWYAGRPTAPPRPFLPEMEEACELIERVVNEAIRQRPQYPLEWAGPEGGEENRIPQWRPNVAAANCYRGAKEAVGYHSDQMTYLGPYPTIASLSLGTTREFRVREVVPKDAPDQREARTYIVPLPHNSLVIMHPPCQERFKHTIPSQNAIDVFRPPFPPGSEPSNARINITFRFYRPDFRPNTTPRCGCGDPCVLRADMKGKCRTEGKVPGAEDVKFFWQCYSGAQNEGKSCGHWSLMDIKKEGRGPVVGL